MRVGVGGDVVLSLSRFVLNIVIAFVCIFGRSDEGLSVTG